MYKELGRKLKRARENCGLTQSQVAAYLGVKREQISYYENGTREIDLVTLSKLADLYGYEVEYFLAGDSAADDQQHVSLAFRAAGLTEKDLEVVARAKRFAMNLAWLDRLLEERTGSD